MPGRDFYVGYQSQAPPALAVFLRRTVILLLLAAAGLAAGLVVLQNRFDPGVFEYGVVREFKGVVQGHPHPMLVVDPPVRVGDATASRFLLVAAGKHGAEGEIGGLDGHSVKIRGSLIYREGEHMIELVGGSVEPLQGAEAEPGLDTVDLGRQTLRGEIVDSKCFLGVMKPGRGKPHRACATRCISGGIPPVLRVESAAGEFLHFLLTDESGGTVNSRVLGFVAEPIEITGQVRRRGDLLLLAADPSGYRRL